MSNITEIASGKTLKLLVIITAIMLTAGFAWSHWSSGPQRVEASTLPDESVAMADNRKKARAAFNDAVKVFFSPRCSNCHPAGDSPLQGDSSKLHDPAVIPGAEGRGTEDVQCAMCHLETNTDGENMPPGVPDWHMPPGQKMVFQGLTAGQLCRNLKDPLKNGGRKSAKDAVQHLATDPKVLWAWAPGNGRTIPPMSHADFLKKMNEWVTYGAACPD